MAGLQQVTSAADQTLNAHDLNRTATEPVDQDAMTMQAHRQMHEMHLAGTLARSLQAHVYVIPAFNGAAAAGSWSTLDCTTRKPGAPPG